MTKLLRTGIATASALSLALFGSVAFADSSQGGANMVILNPGGGAEADGSDGLRMVFNGNDSDEAPNVGSDQVFFAGDEQWCCGGAGPVLAIGDLAIGEAGAGTNMELDEWTSIAISDLTGAYESIEDNSVGSSSTTGNAGVTFTYTYDHGIYDGDFVVTRAISYTSPNNYYDETWTVIIPDDNESTVKFYVGGDAAPGADDNGIGSTVVSGGLRSLREANPDSGQYIAYQELDASQAFTHYFIGHYSDPYGAIAVGDDLDDSIDANEHDAGIQIQWTLGSTPGSYERQMRTTVGFNSDLFGSPATSSVEEEPGDPGIFLTVTGQAGRAFEGSDVVFGSYAIAPNSSYQLIVQSITNPSLINQVLATGRVNSGGHLERTIALPRLVAGSYKIILTGTGAGGERLKLTNHVNVDSAGKFTSVSAERLQPVLN